VGFGAVAILVVWLPLAYASQSIVARVLAGKVGGDGGRVAAEGLDPGEAGSLALVAWLLPTAALLLSGVAGGYVLGRWGERTGPREGAEAGALLALLAMSLSWARTGPSAASLVTLLVIVPAALLGAGLGRRVRERAIP
jgi:tRNA-(ms[2]io[6]A)-hydroxylase